MSSILPKNFQNIYVTNIIPDTATSTSSLSATNITGVNLVVTRATIPNIVLTGGLNANFNSNTLGNIFTTGGNVGINNTAPGFRLDISGSTRINSGGNLYVGNLVGAGNDSVIISPAGNVAITPRSNVTYISGNVGIGTTAPTYNLDINGSFRLQSNVNGLPNILYTVNSNSGSSAYTINAIGNDTGFAFVSFLNSSTRTADGGVRTATIRNDGGALRLQSNFSSTSGIYLNTSGNIGINIDTPTGPLQIGTTALFSSNGNLTCTGDVLAFGSISDQRLKTNIETITPETAINTVKQLNPVTFNWRENIFNNDRQNKFDSGFIAQEVESVLEHATGEYTHIESGTIYKNLKHERIVPYLLRTVQNLLERVELLEGLLRTKS